MKFKSLLPVLAIAMLASCTSKYSYETVKGDKMNSRIYTLQNGLKVYMTENHETPRIQANIAVRVGGKNDPAETTGLAHYFEHLMFKGTEQFGTSDFASEKPLLDQIEQQFEVYRQTTDTAERKAIYHIIDSLSYEASKYAIPNEYDKLMTAIGASGTNAFTSNDVTCYVENIPANQVENWARIQADRFEHAIIRGFHTELETVYEEKNMSLTKDIRKVIETLFTQLFPSHPYGTQTVIGTQEHLKNPSITNIKNYHKTWYVPNNMAICLSGDFDCDKMIATIDKYFGHMQPNPNLPKLEIKEEAPITQPRVAEVLGLEAESIFLSWRFPGAAHPDGEKVELISQILFNGRTGLFDLNLSQQQKILQGQCFNYGLSDYSALIVAGYPKEGQSLDEVKDLFMGELAKLRAGDFEDALLEGILNNYRRSQQAQLTSNNARASMFVDAFVNGSEWADEVGRVDRLAKITKQDIIDFANNYLKDDNCVVIYKRQAPDPNVAVIDKPKITPIQMNRDNSSAFLTEIQNSQVTPIEPRFMDFDKDMSKTKMSNGIEVLYAPNKMNELFTLDYVFDMGEFNDPLLQYAPTYLEYLGTDDMTAEQVKQEFYRMACDYNISVRAERTFISLNGLAENMPQAIALLEKVLAKAQANADIYTNLVADILRARQVGKSVQSQNFNALRRYMKYGPKVAASVVSAQTLAETKPEELVDRIHTLTSYKHRILYYGPASEKELVALLDKEHVCPAQLNDYPEAIDMTPEETPDTKIYIAPYDANQIYMAQYSQRGEKYDAAIEPARALYTEYFDGGMNSIVFQEMRERRALAYTARAYLAEPDYKKYNYEFLTYIATQNDKMMDAVKAFDDIINNMPMSEPAFTLAKDGLLSRMRTNRATGSGILWSYVDALDMGNDHDINREIFAQVQNMTLEDVQKFQQQWVKGRTYRYSILGRKADLDMDALRQMGTVEELTTEQIFGY